MRDNSRRALATVITEHSEADVLYELLGYLDGSARAMAGTAPARGVVRGDGHGELTLLDFLPLLSQLPQRHILLLSTLFSDIKSGFDSGI